MEVWPDVVIVADLTLLPAGFHRPGEWWWTGTEDQTLVLKDFDIFTPECETFDELEPTVDRPEDGCEHHEQNIWSLFPCCSSSGRSEGIEVASTQSLQSQCK